MAPPHPPAAAAPHWRGLVGTILRTGVFVCGALAAMLAPSRDWTWPAAWFVVTAIVAFTLAPAAAFLSVHNPTLIAERERGIRNQGCTGFDTVIVPLLVVLTFARYGAAGAQHDPAATASLASPAMLAAAALEVAALCLGAWSVCSNYWFSSVVRLQTERGHAVCCTGPYRFVRHPGYVSFSLQGFAEAALLQSSWFAWLAAAKALLLVVRARLEDAFLHQSLPGYAAYARRVRYRLVPGVW